MPSTRRSDGSACGVNAVAFLQREMKGVVAPYWRCQDAQASAGVCVSGGIDGSSVVTNEAGHGGLFGL